MKFPKIYDKAAYIGSISDVGFDSEGEYIDVEKYIELDGKFNVKDLRNIADWLEEVIEDNAY